MTPRLLLLETSSAAGWVALAEGQRLLGVRRLEEQRRHARDLVPAARDLLEQHHWRPRELNAVVVGRGPGSYTGLRVGIMAAKTLAYATGCRLIGIESFAAIAEQVPRDVRLADVLADAQQDKLYVQRFERSAGVGHWTPGAPLMIRTVAEWAARLVADVAVTGPGAAKVASRLPAGVTIVGAEHWHPQPETVLRLALARHERGEHDDFWSVEPLYLRPSAAEEKWQQRQASPG